MFPRVLTTDTKAVETEVRATYAEMFPGGDSDYVRNVFRLALDCFGGRYRDYQAIDASYHDVEHTMQGTLCMARLLLGRHRAGVEPRLTERMYQLGILAILFHDSGYLKKRDDTEGTGAKYTLTHVVRSADFAAEILRERGGSPEETRMVRDMILCTGVNSNLDTIPFEDELEKVVGYALGTADLLGQMAAEDYIDKLPVLYEEFAEALRFTHEAGPTPLRFESSSELLQRTPSFWEGYVKPKLDKDFRRSYRFLNRPYPNGVNEYVSRVEANIDRLRKRLAQVPA
jgi:hypothetical protein